MKRGLLILLACFSLRGAVFSAFEPVGIGARARSMGEAFVSVADDYSCIYWNPASLAFIRTKEVGFSYEDRYSLGLVGMSHLAMTYPGFGPGGMGISWTRLAASRSSELNYSENTYTFAYGKKVTDQFAVGSAINFYRLLADVAGSGYSMNFSARYIHNEYLTFGLLWHNGLQTPIRYEGSAQDDLMRDVRVGIAYEPTEWALVSFDVDNLVRQQPKKHLGVECDVLDYPIALRGGISEKTAEGFNWVYSFGGTIKFKKMALDYAVENHFDLGITHLFALRMKF